MASIPPTPRRIRRPQSSTRTATKFDKITYDEIYNRKLKVMDLTATTLCQNNKLPIIVFNMDKPGNLVKLLSGENLGTLVYEG